MSKYVELNECVELNDATGEPWDFDLVDILHIEPCRERIYLVHKDGSSTPLSDPLEAVLSKLKKAGFFKKGRVVTGARKVKKKITRQRRVPSDFVITNEMRTWAGEKCPSANLELETEKFKDHEFDKPKKDWTSAWRNWIRRSVDYAPKQGVAPARRKLADFPE